MVVYKGHPFVGWLHIK